MPGRWVKVTQDELGAVSLSDRELRVWLVFKSFRNSRTHIAWPKRERVAAVLKCKERNLERPVRALIKKGWLTPVNNPRGGQAAAYRVNDADELQHCVVANENSATTICVSSYNNSGAGATTPSSSLLKENKKSIRRHNPSTRDIPFEQDLTDTSWAD